MKMADTPQARIDLAVAKAKVMAISEEIGNIEMQEDSDQAAFKLLWKLGHDLHMSLEEWRIP